MVYIGLKRVKLKGNFPELAVCIDIKWLRDRDVFTNAGAPMGLSQPSSLAAHPGALR